MVQIIKSPALFAQHSAVLNSLGVLTEQRGDSVIARVDAAGDTMHLAREMEYVSAQTYEVLTDPIKGRQFVDFYTVPEGAATWSYDMWDRLAKVELITNYATFVGSAERSKTRTELPLFDYGSSYHYSVQDLQRAAFARTSLPSERALSCRVGHEQFLDDLIATGEATHGVKGLANTTAFQAVQSTIGEWDPEEAEPTDPDEYEAKSIALFNDFNKLLDSVETNTAEQFSANFTIWPLSFKKVFARRFSRYDARTREQVMLAGRQGVTLKYWKRLNTASDLGGPKALAYAKNPLVLQFAIAYDFREMPPQASAYAYQVATYARAGGLHVRYPLACSRMDLDEDLTP